MSNYVVGGWTQYLSQQPPSQFGYTMYGMITNLTGLTSGSSSSPGWSPNNQYPPSTSGKVLWTYGGESCSPHNMPVSSTNIDEIVNATNSYEWDGVDFDDECQMNIDNIIYTMKALKPKETSYTFLAGWAYNNPDQDPNGKIINENVQKLASADVCDRFILMCYGAEMWSINDIEANVEPALNRTIGYVKDSKKVILALTPVGLNQENLNYFLHQVQDKNLGGLFIWEFPNLNQSDLNTIINVLDI